MGRGEIPEDWQGQEGRRAKKRESFGLPEFGGPILLNALTRHIKNNLYIITPVLLHGKSHGQRNRVGCSPWGR